ncbi:hypothetical protein B0A49_05796 [Cryomyces minteri]|uniref:Uncharacterized protein n=1 Tax=Cryomyces minteri TaxID=331657 RepID=A0A4U0X862_9PEZI|nr:hypothetical protein B0A49_05796 [Cryomyces minteri]
MADSSRPSTAAFDPDWKPADTTSLRPDNLSIPRIPRAWERQPRSPYARDRNLRKVWKRYDLRSQQQGAKLSGAPSSKQEYLNGRRPKELFRSPEKVVKKLCFADTVEAGQLSKATLWDKKGRSLTRKLRANTGEVNINLNATVPEGIAPRTALAGPSDDVDPLLKAERMTEVYFPSSSSHAPYEDNSVPIADVQNIFSINNGAPGLLNMSSSANSDSLMETDVKNAETIAQPIGDLKTELVVHSDQSDEITLGDINDVVGQTKRRHRNNEPVSDEHLSFNEENVHEAVECVHDEDSIALPDSDLSAQDVSHPNTEIDNTGSQALGHHDSSLTNNPDDVLHETEPPLTPSTPKGDAFLSDSPSGRNPKMSTIGNGHDTVPGSRYDTVQESLEEDGLEDTTQKSSLSEAPGVSSDLSAPLDLIANEASFPVDTNTTNGIEQRRDNRTGLDISLASALMENNSEATGDGQELFDALDTMYDGTYTEPDRAHVDIIKTMHSSDNTEGSPDLQSEAAPMDEDLGNGERAQAVAAPSVDGTQVQTRTMIGQGFQEPERSPGVSSPPNDTFSVSLQPVISDIGPMADGTGALVTSKPRVSDDTAILQAFLNRAAASKASKSVVISKRSSLSHRRDSDAVRHALASPGRLDVLEDKDPNSPSPRRRTRAADAAEIKSRLFDFDADSFGGVNTYEKVANEGVPTAAKARRSARSRSRIPHFPALTPTSATQSLAASSLVAPASAPNKIPVRSAADPVILRKSEAQELNLVTKANTRKNKGGSVAPVMKLAKIAAAIVAGEHHEDEIIDSKELGEGLKGVKWDQQLVYFQEAAAGSPDPLTLDAYEDGIQEQVHAQLMEEAKEDSTQIAKEGSTETPKKPMGRRLRGPQNGTPAKGLVSSVSSAVMEIPPKEPEKKPRRQLRTDTPAKGLLESALPDDVEVPSKLSPRKAKKASRIGTPAPNATVAKVTSDTKALAQQPAESKSPKKATRKLPVPRKLNLFPTTTEGKENRLVTSRKTGITTVKSLAFPPQSSANNDTPGLTSPAKKRVRPVGGNVSATAAPVVEMPSLLSPAKKRSKPRG